MKKYIGVIAAAVALTGATSCSPYTLVNSDVYNNADLAQIHTFHIVTTDEGNLPPGMTMVTYYNIAAAIREQLVDRGWVEDANSPILVNIGLTVKKEVAYNAFTTPGVWVTPPPMWGQPLPPAPKEPPTDAAQVPVNPNLPDVQLNGGPGLQAPPASSGMHLEAPAAQRPQPAPGPGPVPGPRPPMQRPVPGPVYNGFVPYYMFPRSYYIPGPTQIVPSVYREGVLSMDIVNMSTKTPLYSSSVATILDAGDTQFRNLAGIAQAVKVLFSKFPVKELQ